MSQACPFSGANVAIVGLDSTATLNDIHDVRLTHAQRTKASDEQTS